MHDIIASVLPIFLITALGYIIKKRWITSEEFWRNLEKLSYFVLFPAVLFNYTSNADCGNKELIKLVLIITISTLTVSSALIYYQKKYNYDKVQFTSVFQGAIRYNSYIFFALSGALFSDKGLSIASVIAFYMIILTNVLSVLIFAKYIDHKNDDKSTNSTWILINMICTNPLIVSCFAGFCFNYLDIKLYLGFKKTIQGLAESALAIGMINVGAGLRFVFIPNQFKNIALTSSIKLILIPILTYILSILLFVSGVERAMGVLYSCMPCATTAYILSRQLGGDPESMSSIIMFSTIASIVTIPIMMYFLT